jgi:hypothetical protein
MRDFSIDIGLYERLTAIRRAIGMSTSDYLERAKASMADGMDFTINGHIVKIKNGHCLN